MFGYEFTFATLNDVRNGCACVYIAFHFSYHLFKNYGKTLNVQEVD